MKLISINASIYWIDRKVLTAKEIIKFCGYSNVERFFVTVKGKGYNSTHDSDGIVWVDDRLIIKVHRKRSYRFKARNWDF